MEQRTSQALQFLESVQILMRRVRRAERNLGVTAFCLAFLLGLFVLDALFPFSVWGRGAAMGVGIVGAVWMWKRGSRKVKVELLPDALARTVERHFPQTDNALIHAVQFADGAGALSGTRAVFVAREHARANETASHIAPHSCVERAALRRVRVLLLLLLLCWACLLIWGGRVVRFATPRFFAVGSDAPPFTLTDFEIAPLQAQVPSGASMKITVRVGGKLPSSLVLVTETEGGKPQSVPMTSLDGQTYALTLQNLTMPTRFYASADTGRSPSGRISIQPPKNQVQAENSKNAKPTPNFETQAADEGKQQKDSQEAQSGGETGTGRGDDKTPAPPIRKPTLSREAAETLRSHSAKPFDANDAASDSRYPPAYRRLLRDYFQASSSR